ncbi:hypothetical protein CTN07_07425 [Photobacterium damselae]|nr:hypothetical protein CTN07_07425 [Photobacterium damselae]
MIHDKSPDNNRSWRGLYSTYLNKNEQRAIVCHCFPAQFVTACKNDYACKAIRPKATKYAKVTPVDNKANLKLNSISVLPYAP